MCIAENASPGQRPTTEDRTKLPKGRRKRTVGDQAKTVGPNTIHHLHDHVGEVEAQEKVDALRFRRLEDRFDRRAEMAVKGRQPSEERRLCAA